MRRVPPDRLSDDHRFHFIVFVVEAALIGLVLLKLA